MVEKCLKEGAIGVGRKIVSEDIYDALYDDEAFANLPQLLADMVDARSWIVGWVYNDGTQVLPACSSYWTKDMIAEYSRDFAHIDPWTLALAEHIIPNKVIDLGEFVPDSEWERSALYNDYFRKHGDDTYRSMSLGARNAIGAGCIAFHRGKSQSPFDKQTQSALEELGRHVGRVLRFRARMLHLEIKLRDAESMLGLLPGAAILVRSDGFILKANAAAESLLRRGRFVSQRQYHLEINGAGATKVWNAIRAACAQDSVDATALILNFGKDVPIVMTVLPAKMAGGLRGALLSFQDPDGARDRTILALQRLFGLTLAEAAIASDVSVGRSPAEISNIRKVSIGTVRLQIKHAMGKLGCTRQAELAALVHQLPSVPTSHTG